MPLCMRCNKPVKTEKAKFCSPACAGKAYHWNRPGWVADAQKLWLAANGERTYVSCIQETLPKVSKLAAKSLVGPLGVSIRKMQRKLRRRLMV